MGSLDKHALRRLVRSQAGLASRSQLQRAGIGRDAVRAQVDARRWQKVGSVVVLHNAALTPQQRLWCAVLDQPAPCALAGITAAVAWGLRTRPHNEIEVLIQSGARPRRRPGVVVRTTARGFAVGGGGLPRVSMERAIVDAAIWESDPHVAGGLFVAAFQQRLARVEGVRDELSVAGDQRHVLLMRRLLPEIESGAGSLAEIEFVRLARLAGLPEPARQVRLRDGTRSFYVDIDFGHFAVEVDGPMHWRGDIDSELARQNAIVRGKRLLRFTTVAIWTNPKAVIASLMGAWRDLAA